MKTEKRNDVHRRGAFRPEGYIFVGWYYLVPGKPVGTDGKTNVQRMSETIQAWVSSQEAADWKAEIVYGDFGRCGVCGARFAEGEVWQQNGDEGREMVHIGRDCAEKYEMSSGTGWTALHDERMRAAKAARTKARNSADRERIMAAYPGLDEAFKVNHYIIADIARKFDNQPGKISEKQIALVLKIANEINTRQAQAAQEKHVQAPVGRQTIRGSIVSKKTVDGVYGSQVKIVVKVETPEGSWLCYGTAPSGLWRKDDGGNTVAPERGDTVEFTATLNDLADRRDAHFAFFSRPTATAAAVTNNQQVST